MTAEERAIRFLGHCCREHASGGDNKFQVNHEHDQGGGPQGKGDAAGTEHSASVLDEFEAKRTDEYCRSCQYNRHADHRKPIQDFKNSAIRKPSLSGNNTTNFKGFPVKCTRDIRPRSHMPFFALASYTTDNHTGGQGLL